MSRNLARKILILPVKLYQKLISPLLGQNCIYEPSCSHYMIEAITKHGIPKGLILGISRILRCNRFFLGGNDPVPQKFSWKAVSDPWVVFKRLP